MSDPQVLRRPAAQSPASRQDDIYREDAKLARMLMLAEYARITTRTAPLARDVQPVPVPLSDAPFARARSMQQQSQATLQQEQKLRAPQQAPKAPSPRPVPTTPPPASARFMAFARQAQASVASETRRAFSTPTPKQTSPATPKQTSPAPEPAGTRQPHSRVQSPGRLTEKHRASFTFYGDGIMPRDDVFHAVQANFGRVEVAGDGNCGFYSLLAGLVFQAMDFPESRSTIVRRLRELGSDTNQVDRAFKRIAQELRYATAREPRALRQGKQALRDLANELALRPDGAMAYVQSHGAEFEKACYVLRATSVAAYNDQNRSLDNFALVDDDLAPLSSTFGISLVVPSVDPSAAAWTPTRLRDLSQARYRAGEIHLLHTQNHFDLLLPLRA